MYNINYFLRKRRKGANYSIEQIFDHLSKRFSSTYYVNNKILPFVSSGIYKRLINILYALTNQGDINHITGDINYVAIFLRKHKTISTIHDLAILHRTKGIKRKILLTFWFKWPVYRSRWVTVISESTKRDLLKNVNCNPDKIRVINVPISKSFSRVDKVFDKECPTIMQIGGADNKNLKGLIAAVKDIKCNLLIIGKISEDNLNSLKKYNISFVNRVGLTFEEVIKSYVTSDILFFASTFEGFGMPILEAQAVGRPVITSNIFSMPEVGGDAAIYVDPYDFNQIKIGIQSIIEDASLRQELIEKGFKNTLRFDRDTIADQYESLYIEMLKK